MLLFASFPIYAALFFFKKAALFFFKKAALFFI